jgi:hypothetical protein
MKRQKDNEIISGCQFKLIHQDSFMMGSHGCQKCIPGSFLSGYSYQDPARTAGEDSASCMHSLFISLQRR